MSTDLQQEALENVSKTFGDYERYREGLTGTGRKWFVFKKDPEKNYQKLINKERKRLEKQRKKKEKLYQAKDVAMICNEANITLTTCKVTDDHRIKFRHAGQKKEVRINPELGHPQVLLIPSTLILANFNWFIRMLVMFLFPAKGFRYRTYTARSEGEITHDPSIDHYHAGDKIRLEELLKVEGAMAKAGFVKAIAKGLKDKVGLWEMFPIIAIVLIVFFFLMAYQVVPYF